MLKTFNVSLDIADSTQKNPYYQSFSFSQNDLNTIEININLKKNGVPLDVTGVTPRIAIKKPNKLTVFQDCTIMDAILGKINVILDTQSYNDPGLHLVEVYLYEGSEILVPGRFSYISNEAILNDKAVESSNDWQSINSALIQIDESFVQIEDKLQQIENADVYTKTEVNTSLGQKANQSDVGNLANLTTTDKTSLVNAVNNTVSLLADKAKQSNLRKFNPLWGLNMYVKQDLVEAKSFVDIALSLSMDSLIFTVDFQDFGDSFYCSYAYDTRYKNINDMLDYTASKGIKVKAIKVHTNGIDFTNVNFFTKYIAGLNLLISYLTSTNKPENFIILNEVNEMIYSYSTYGTGMINSINAVKSAGYKVGISFSSSFQYVSACHPNIMSILDVIGLNIYPQITPNISNASVSDGIEAWKYSELENTAKMLKLSYPNAKIWISETGIFDNMNALVTPGTSWVQGYVADGQGVPSEIYFTGMFETVKSSKTIEGVYGWWVPSLNTTQLINLSKRYIKGEL